MTAHPLLMADLRVVHVAGAGGASPSVHRPARFELHRPPTPTRSPPCRALRWLGGAFAPGFALRARASAWCRGTYGVSVSVSVSVSVQCHLQPTPRSCTCRSSVPTACFSVGSAGSRTLAQMRRAVPLRVLSDREHYDEVMQAVLGAERSVWVATANLKDVMVEDPRVIPGRRRGRRSNYRSVLEVFSELAQRGLELRILHASPPSRAFRRSFDAQPELVSGGIEMRVCPRVHLKTVVVDARLVYLGSANWTGAGLGAKGDGVATSKWASSPPTSRRSIRCKNDTIEYGAAPNAPPAASEKNAKCPSTRSRDTLPPPNTTDFNKLRPTPRKSTAGSLFLHCANLGVLGFRGVGRK